MLLATVAYMLVNAYIITAKRFILTDYVSHWMFYGGLLSTDVQT